MRIHDRLVLFIRHVRQLAAVFRPAWRNDRFVGCQYGLRVFSVSIGHLQLVTLALLEDVGNTGGKNAAVAGEFFVNHIGNAVRRRAYVGRASGIAHAGDLGFAYRIVKTEIDLDAAVRLAAGRTHRQRIGATALPLGMIDYGGIGGRRIDACGVDHAEQAAALQISLDHWRQVFAVIGKWHNRNRNLFGRAGDDFDRHFGAGDAG